MCLSSFEEKKEMISKSIRQLSFCFLVITVIKPSEEENILTKLKKHEYNFKKLQVDINCLNNNVYHNLIRNILRNI